MIEFLNKKLKDYKIVLDEIKKYVDIVKKYNNVSSIVDDQIDIVQKKLDCVKIVLSYKGDFSAIFKQVIVLTHDYVNIKELLNDIIEMLSIDDNTMINSNDFTSSETIKLVTKKLLIRIVSKYNNVEKKYDHEENEFINYICNILVNKIDYEITNENTDINTYIEFMDNIYKNKQYSTVLYTQIIKSLLNRYENNKINYYKLISYIETKKSDSLNTHLKIKNKNLHLKNPLLKSFELTPQTSYYPLNDIIKKLFPSQINKSLKSVCKRNHVDFIILNTVTPNVINYSIYNILKTKISDSNGVSNNMIHNMNMISTYGDSKWDYSIDYITEKENSYEKLNENICILNNIGDYYCVLAPWKESKSFIVKKHTIKHIYGYINLNEYDRVTNYNNLQINKALSNMFVKPLTIDIMETHSKVYDINLLKNSLYLKLTNYLFKKIKDGFSNKKVLDVLNSDELKDIFVDELLSKYDYIIDSVSNYYKSGKKYETYLSYVNMIEYLSINFMKSLYDKYVANIKNDAPTKTKLKDYVFNLVENVIDGNDNLFNIIGFKHLLITNPLDGN